MQIDVRVSLAHEVIMLIPILFYINACIHKLTPVIFMASSFVKRFTFYADRLVPDEVKSKILVLIQAVFNVVPISNKKMMGTSIINLDRSDQRYKISEA